MNRKVMKNFKEAVEDKIKTLKKNEDNKNKFLQDLIYNLRQLQGIKTYSYATGYLNFCETQSNYKILSICDQGYYYPILAVTDSKINFLRKDKTLLDSVDLKDFNDYANLEKRILQYIQERL